jgi:type I site-specific restriction-modification system R (restriction) subunit
MKDENGKPLTYQGGLAENNIEELAGDYALNRGVSKGIEQRIIDGFMAGYNKANENYKMVSSIRELHQYKLGLEDGYNKAKETLYTKQDLVDLVQNLKDYTYESHTILGHDEREANEFVDIFIQDNTAKQ